MYKNKNLTYFDSKENLDLIIKKELSNYVILNINKISSGWTNIVFDVETEFCNFIFRFPREEYFAGKIEKDVIANNFLKKNLNIKTVDMKILYDKNRAFSIHKKIPGNSLTNRINQISEKKENEIAIEIANFFYKLHNIDINTIPEVCKIKLSDFLINLPKINQKEYDYSTILDLQKDEENNYVFVHGDLNIGNIILDNDDNINAFIDFSFTGLSDIYCDLSRISCRISDNFLKKILNQYEFISGKKLDMEKIKQRNKMWNYIEEQYIIFMKNTFPEIKI